MAVAKRVILFLIVNLLVIVTISIVLSLLGIGPYMTRYGIDYTQLAEFCLVWGMGGAFISLAMSRMAAKWMMGVEVINPDTRDSSAQELVQIVHTLARGANLPKMPEVGVYNSPEVNAFATGPTKSRALVAVSSGLLNRMNRSQIEGVLGHEISHIANGDMVTMTLVQGIINAFVMFFARIAAYAVTQLMRSNDDEKPSYFMQSMLTFLFEILLSFLGMIVVAAFSRWREFRADRGGARLAGTPKMIGALEALQNTTQLIDNRQKSLAAFKISGHRGGLALLFATHPPLEVRIQRLRNMQS